jgi:ubiquinone/menaquinone biosynthesis C-methylase UbiE
MRNKQENIGWKGDSPTEIVTSNFENGVVKPGDKLLDIGCGFGRNSNWLASKGLDVTAININDEEINEAKKSAKKLNADVNYIHANAIELPFKDNSFDVALDLGCSHMIPSKDGQEKAAKEASRVVKHGGILIYFGFSKDHPLYLKNPDNPMFRSIEDVQSIYGNDFEILSQEETQWKPKPEENSDINEHVGINVVMKRK